MLEPYRRLLDTSKDHERLESLVAAGAGLYKHGRFGKPHKRFACVRGHSICWSKSRDAKEKTTALPLADSIVILEGKQTDVLLRRTARDVDPKLCFSIVFSSRTVDFQCDTHAQCVDWVRGCHLAVARAKIEYPEQSLRIASTRTARLLLASHSPPPSSSQQQSAPPHHQRQKSKSETESSPPVHHQPNIHAHSIAPPHRSNTSLVAAYHSDGGTLPSPVTLARKLRWREYMHASGSSGNEHVQPMSLSHRSASRQQQSDESWAIRKQQPQYISALRCLHGGSGGGDGVVAVIGGASQNAACTPRSNRMFGSLDR